MADVPRSVRFEVHGECHRRHEVFGVDDEYSRRRRHHECSDICGERRHYPECATTKETDKRDAPGAVELTIEQQRYQEPREDEEDPDAEVADVSEGSNPRE